MAHKRCELSEQQYKAIELLAKGENTSETARLIGVHRKTVITWKKDVKFKAELDRQVAEIKSGIEKKIALHCEPLMNELFRIALKSDSDNVRLNAIEYCMDRILGKATNKTADVTEEVKKEQEIDIDNMLEELDNVIDLKKVN